MLLIHQIVSHLELAEKSLDATADIQELCETIMFNSKATYISRLDDTSIASASMKAFRGVEPRRGPAPAGRVIWVVSALKLKNAFRNSQMAHLEGPGGTATIPLQPIPLPDPPKYRPNSQPSSEAEKQSEDLLDIFMNRVDQQDHAYYDHARPWVEQGDSLILKLKGAGHDLLAPPRPTHLFLTDMGYSGITVSEVKLGDKAYKRSEADCNITFQHGATSSESTEEGICLNSRTTFQELLSWVL